MIQVYTGNGKGKTTAALGLALRTAGAGLKVYIAQFVKKGGYHELNSLEKIKNIKIEQFGRGCFINKKPGKEDILLARKGLERVRGALAEKKYKLLVLDEINIAMKLKLLKAGEVLKLLKSIPDETEVVLTGRGAPEGILKIADLVSEMKEIKHYYHKGILARRGIEF